MNKLSSTWAILLCAWTGAVPGAAAQGTAADRILAIVRRDSALSHPEGYAVTLQRRPHGVDGAITYLVGTRPVGEKVGFRVSVNAVGYDDEMDSDEKELDGGPRVLGMDEGLAHTY